MLRYSRFFLLITLAATLFHACDKSEFYSGKGVSFNASSKSIATKVSYGDETNGIRAIKWQDKDKILIYCPQTTEKQCDYVVDVNKVTSYDGIVSIAKGVSPVGDALKWSEGEHKFYCVYPSPPPSVSSEPFDVDNNSWQGTIPAVQYYPDGGEYSDLSQYMMLVGYAECAEPQPAVNVDFYPVTTCLEFEMTNKGKYDLIINSISLSSSEPLSGDFKVTYNGKLEGEDRFVTEPGSSTSKSVEVNFGEEGQAFNIGSDLSFKMFLNPAEDIINPTLTINAERKGGVSVVLSTTLKKKNNVDLKILKKHITPLTGILVEGGILFTTFGEPELVQWEDDVEDNITVSDEYEYFLEVVGDSSTLNFDDSGTGLTKTLQVKSYKQAKDGTGTKTHVKPSLEFSESPFVGTNPTITLFDSDECIYDIEFIAEQNSPVVTTVDVSSALKNATPVSNYNLSSGGTANCYVVKAPGTYKFEIAYGNKTKYDNTYDGTTKKPAGSTVDVLWSTSENLITNLAVSDGYITFEVKEDYIQQGNALIVLKNGSTITWSWHIWFTDAKVSNVPLGYYSTGTRTLTTYSKRVCTVVVSNPYDPFKSSNAIITMSQGEDKEETTDTITASGCTYYQWGRKDPFMPGDTPTLTNQAGAGVSINNCINNPTTLYRTSSGSYTGPCMVSNYNPISDLWLNNSKTIFDPSPYGYRVPSQYTGNLPNYGYYKLSSQTLTKQKDGLFWTAKASESSNTKDQAYSSSSLKYMCEALPIIPVATN